MTRVKLPPPYAEQVSDDRVPGRASTMSGARIAARTAAIATLFGSVMAAVSAGHCASALPFGAAKGPGAAMAVTKRGSAVLMLAGAEAFKVEDVAGPSGLPLSLKLQLPENPTVSYSFLMFRNLPPKFTLSSGFGAKDYWAVSLHDVDGLKVIPPEGYEGAFTMEVLLVKGHGVDPERRAARVVFASKASAAPIASAGDKSKVLTASRAEETTASIQSLKPQRQSAELTEIDQSMLLRGDTYMKQGDIAAARLLYKQLAKKGIAHGALAMGNTFDPEFLASLAVAGLRPDIAQAKNWYRMAEELGSAMAAKRLATLNAQGN